MGAGALLVAALLLAQTAPAHAAFAMGIDKFDSANEEGVYSYRIPRIAAGHACCLTRSWIRPRSVSLGLRRAHRMPRTA